MITLLYRRLLIFKRYMLKYLGMNCQDLYNFQTVQQQQQIYIYMHTYICVSVHTYWYLDKNKYSKLLIGVELVGHHASYL